MVEFDEYSEGRRLGRRRKAKTMGKEHWSVTAEEPGWEMESSGPHAPNFLRLRMFTGLKGDLGSIFLLLFLYLLQGIPLGLIASVPLMLQSRHVTYAQQAVFSFAYWPFRYILLHEMLNNLLSFVVSSIRCARCHLTFSSNSFRIQPPMSSFSVSALLSSLDHDNDKLVPCLKELAWSLEQVKFTTFCP